MQRPAQASRGRWTKLLVDVSPLLLLLVGRASLADRYWGFVPRENLLGRAVAVLYSQREGLSAGERWWLPLLPEEGTGLDPRLTR